MQSWKDSPGSVSSGKDMPERVRSGISPHFSSSSRALAAVPAFIIAVSKSKDGLKRGVFTGPRSQLDWKYCPPLPTGGDGPVSYWHDLSHAIWRGTREISLLPCNIPITSSWLSALWESYALFTEHVGVVKHYYHKYSNLSGAKSELAKQSLI